MGGRRFVVVAIAAMVGGLTVAPAAQASFHEISIREVYPGSVAQPDSDYVELQMYASGQNLVGGYGVTVYGANGSVAGTFTFPPYPFSLPNGANQQTILIGDSGVQGAFVVTPDLTNTNFAVDPAGGAACWAGSYDCVSWGGFAGSTPSSSGTPADGLGIPDGMALRRTIAPGCPTLLEFGDDSNDSSTDLQDATPNPRNNASAITENACTGPVDTIAPTVTIDSHPADPSGGASASFTFHSSEVGSQFACSLVQGADPDAFSVCSSGKTYTSLVDGDYTFKVRATDAASNQGAATVFSWTVDHLAVDTTPPDTVIDSAPPNPSGGSTASFTYHATEPGPSFECKLDGATFAGCPVAGIAYTGLANGSHTFVVRAIDSSANIDPTPAGYTFDVALSSPLAPAVVPPALAPVSSVAAPPRKKMHRRCRRGKRHRAHQRPRRCRRGKHKHRLQRRANGGSRHRPR